MDSYNQNKVYKTTNKTELLKSRMKEVNPFSSLASFPCNIRVQDQNSDEYILLLVRKHKAILFANLLFYSLLLFFPFLVKFLVSYVDSRYFNSALRTDSYFGSNYWLATMVLWYSYLLRGYYNIFIKWYYDINLLTTHRFIDLDLIGIFKNRMEEASVLSIEDAKDTQSGLLQSLFKMGDLEILTASEHTVFSLEDVPQSSQVRDFIMDVVIESKNNVGG